MGKKSYAKLEQNWMIESEIMIARKSDISFLSSFSNISDILDSPKFCDWSSNS
jgi:hypothetical protein